MLLDKSFYCINLHVKRNVYFGISNKLHTAILFLLPFILILVLSIRKS